MYVKLNFGPRQGEVVDLAPQAAIDFLADGRASRAFTDPEPKVPAGLPDPAMVAPSLILSGSTGKKKRRL